MGRAHGAGLSLFSKGKGDDLSGWKILNVTMDISEQSFSHQFRVSICLYVSPNLISTGMATFTMT
jgi:hypothetical protein